MLERLRKLNPNIKFYSVEDEEFSSFGRVIRDFDASEIIKAAETLETPAGVRYVASLPEFEALPSAKEIENRFFGNIPAQAGYCYGHNSMMNATEWHTSSEINIAVTPIVLILGHLWDYKNERIDSSEFSAFYLPKGTVIEAYATTLHYCACQVSDDGFGCFVGLPLGTNTALEITADSRHLVAKNKWLIAHSANKGLVDAGRVPGITGENLCIKY